MEIVKPLDDIYRKSSKIASLRGRSQFVIIINTIDPTGQEEGTMRTIGIGLIGWGFMGRAHTHALRSIPLF